MIAAPATMGVAEGLTHWASQEEASAAGYELHTLSIEVVAGEGYLVTCSAGCPLGHSAFATIQRAQDRCATHALACNLWGWPVARPVTSG